MSVMLYVGFMVAVAIERMVELGISKRHQRIAFSAGATEHFPRHFKAMSLMHTLFLIACVAEVIWFKREFIPALGIPCLVLALLCQGLRYWVIATLKERWNVRIIVWPSFPPITTGPYRYLRHPNYLGVVIEMVVLPMIHNAWITAVVFSIANACVLYVRIKAEEQALGEHYRATFANKSRFIPAPPP